MKVVENVYISVNHIVMVHMKVHIVIHQITSLVKLVLQIVHSMHLLEVLHIHV